MRALCGVNFRIGRQASPWAGGPTPAHPLGGGGSQITCSLFPSEVGLLIPQDLGVLFDDAEEGGGGSLGRDAALFPVAHGPDTDPDGPREALLVETGPAPGRHGGGHPGRPAGGLRQRLASLPVVRDYLLDDLPQLGLHSLRVIAMAAAQKEIRTAPNVALVLLAPDDLASVVMCLGSHLLMR